MPETASELARATSFSVTGWRERTQRDARARGFGRRDMFTDNRCANRVITGAALGATVGGAGGAVYGTYESFAYKVRRRCLLARDSFPNRRSRATRADRRRRNRQSDRLPPRAVPSVDSGHAESEAHRPHDRGKRHPLRPLPRSRQPDPVRQEVTAGAPPRHVSRSHYFFFDGRKSRALVVSSPLFFTNG